MRNDKIEFETTGIPSELVSDGGSSYQTAEVFKGDNKRSKDKKAVKEPKNNEF
jgi:hypothetical protein